MGERRNSIGFFPLSCAAVIYFKNYFALCNISGLNLFIMECVVLHPKDVLQSGLIYSKKDIWIVMGIVYHNAVHIWTFKEIAGEMKYLFFCMFCYFSRSSVCD